MASAHCAAELRRRGADGEILLVGREPEPPYERPPLSKEYLRGESKREDAFVHPPEWYEENAVELRSGTNVMAFDAAARTAKLQGGEEVAFDKALLATGANVNILRVDGAARRHPLPARVRQLRLDPRRRRGRRARRPDRRQLHRLRGRGVADGDGQQVHDRDARGRGPLADVRRGARAGSSTTRSFRTGSSSSAARSWRRSRGPIASRRCAPRAASGSSATR